MLSYLGIANPNVGITISQFSELISFPSMTNIDFTVVHIYLCTMNFDVLTFSRRENRFSISRIRHTEFSLQSVY